MSNPVRELFFIVESARQNDHLVKGKIIPFKTAYRYYHLLTGNRIHSFIKSFVASAQALGVIAKEGKEITVFLNDYNEFKKMYPDEFKEAMGRLGGSK